MVIWVNSSKAIQISLGLLITVFELDDGFEDINDNSDDMENISKETIVSS